MTSVRPTWKRFAPGRYGATVALALKDPATGLPLIAATVERVDRGRWHWTWGQRNKPNWRFEEGDEPTLVAAKAQADRMMRTGGRL